MSLDIGVTDDWADGTYTFRLGVKQLDELQDITGIGAELLYYRFTTPTQSERNWKTRWMRETIRLALIGGGTEPTKAEKLCRIYVDDEPKLPNLTYAIGALGGALLGVKNAVKKKPKHKETASVQPMQNQTTELTEPTSPTSTETSRPSA